MDLGRDAFTITYDPSQTEPGAITARIRRLGYEPEEAPAGEPPQAATADPGQDIPEPVAGALAEARKTGRLLLIDFHAEWCAPCRLLDARILTDPRVRQALESFHFLKLDTDRYVKPPHVYKVVGLPTLLVLDPNGAEVYRHEGMIGAAELAGDLTALAKGKAPVLDEDAFTDEVRGTLLLGEKARRGE